jgi:hypothetical protein
MVESLLNPPPDSRTADAGVTYSVTALGSLGLSRSTALQVVIISRRLLPNGIARERAGRFVLVKGFLDDLVGDIERLADGLEAAREALSLEPFDPGVGGVGLFQDKTHFSDTRDAAPGLLNCPIFCGRRRDTPDELGGDHA